MFCLFKVLINILYNCCFFIIYFKEMTAPGEILEYEVHLTSQEIKEEPEDEVDCLQVRNRK